MLYPILHTSVDCDALLLQSRPIGPTSDQFSEKEVPPPVDKLPIEKTGISVMSAHPHLTV